MPRGRKRYDILEEDFQAELLFTDTGLEIKAPYRKEFLEVFKEVIRSSYRKWDADSKVWIVIEPAYFNTAADLVRQFYPDVIEADLRRDTGEG